MSVCMYECANGLCARTIGMHECMVRMASVPARLECTNAWCEWLVCPHDWNARVHDGVVCARTIGMHECMFCLHQCERAFISSGVRIVL